MFLRTMLMSACFTIFIRQSYCLTPRQAYEEIVKIVNSNPPPKGIPFPSTIPSPQSVNDKIAIVGAGPAGIHMAYLLKKKGFQNINVYEKSDRIGGKSLTVTHRDTFHEMGTCYTNPDYEKNVIALAKEYGLWEPVSIPSANVWLDPTRLKPSLTPIAYGEYVVEEIKKILKANNATRAQLALLKAMIRYCALHREIFGKYEGDLMRRPYRQTMDTLRCSFERFLMKNNLLVLKPIFIASHTVQGYGHLNEISALYGLMWNTPSYIQALAERFILIKSDGLRMIRGGFQNLWTTIVEKENIDVFLNTSVTRVKRYSNKVRIYTHHEREWCSKEFDFLIWTPSVYTTRNILDPNGKERNIFSRLRPVWFSTTIFSSTYGVRGNSPIDYWLDNVKNKREHSLWAQRDSYGTLNQYEGEAYRNGSLPGAPDGQFIRTGVAYQYGKRKPPNMSCLEKILRKSLKDTQATNIEIVRQESWEYFPKFSPNDMADGVLWDIFKIQGNRRTWFAGSSVNFESVKSVIEYNKLLVSRMKDATP